MQTSLFPFASLLMLVLALPIQGFSSAPPSLATTRQQFSTFRERRSCVALRVQAEQNKGFKKDDYSAAARDEDDVIVSTMEEEVAEEETPVEITNGATTAGTTHVEETNTFESDVNDQQAELDEEFMGMAIEMALSG